MIPFTTEEFLKVFERYNLAIFPLQFAAYFLGALVAAGLATRSSWAPRFALGVLALMWVWNGMAYHAVFFRVINPAAIAFAVFFVVQSGLLFLKMADATPPASSRSHPVLGWAAITYALVIYPALGILGGHNYPASPVFGVAPCPTTIFTFGVLWVLGQSTLRLTSIPLAWSIIGSVAALKMGMREDIGLTITALLCGMTLWRDRVAAQDLGSLRRA